MKYFLLAAVVSACTLAAQSNAGASIEGHVVNPLTGVPVRKAAVVLSTPAGSVRLIADTDADGKFAFTGLPLV